MGHPFVAALPGVVHLGDIKAGLTDNFSKDNEELQARFGSHSGCSEQTRTLYLLRFWKELTLGQLEIYSEIEQPRSLLLTPF